MTIADANVPAVQNLIRAGYQIEIQEEHIMTQPTTDPRDLPRPGETVMKFKGSPHLPVNYTWNRTSTMDPGTLTLVVPLEDMEKIEGAGPALANSNIASEFEIVVRIKKSFKPGHYQLKRRGPRASAIYYSLPPWEKPENKSAHNSNADDWQRVEVKPA